MTTLKEKKHMSLVAELGCAVCRRMGYAGTPAELHHIRRGGVRSLSPVIGLCPYHHRGSNTSIHGMGRKQFEIVYQITEEELLEQTKRLIGE